WCAADHHDRLAIAHEELERFANGDPTFRADEVIRLSLAGAQHKISAIQDNGLWWPGSQDASTHILKFDSPRFANLSVNEFFMRCLAEHLDLPVAAARLDVTTSKPFLVVERYDRRVVEGRVERLHQEDFCQALALSHHHKYEGTFGPTLTLIAQTIREHSYRPARDIQSLLRWVMFNVLAGNADGHAKNLSLLRTEAGLQLAPFYDLVCTRAYQNLDRLMAFSMAGSRDADTYGVMHWKGLATSLGVAPRVVLAELKRMHREYEDGIAFATQETRVFVDDPNVLDPLISEVAKRFRAASNVLNAKGW
ncbi:MAG: HipA domain-containing protein, partial [bacterium]